MLGTGTNCYHERSTTVKGTVSRDCRPLGFPSNNTPGSTDSWASGFENRFVTAAIFDYENRKFSFLFYYHGVGKITGTSRPFLLYCCFNICYKSRNIGILMTSRYDAWRRVSHDSALCTLARSRVSGLCNIETRLCAMLNSAEFLKKHLSALCNSV
jgi:hypothetical protein